MGFDLGLSPTQCHEALIQNCGSLRLREVQIIFFKVPPVVQCSKWLYDKRETLEQLNPTQEHNACLSAWWNAAPSPSGAGKLSLWIYWVDLISKMLDCIGHLHPPTRWREQFLESMFWQCWLCLTVFLKHPSWGKDFLTVQSPSINFIYLHYLLRAFQQQIWEFVILRHWFSKQWLKGCFGHYFSSRSAININLLSASVLFNTRGHKRKYSSCP